MKNILNIIKDSNYSLYIFDQKLIDELESKITFKDSKPYVVCAIRDKEIVLKPEEVVRQLFVMKLMKEYGYPKKLIKFEVNIRFGREVGIKRADIAVYKEDLKQEHILIEVKKPNAKDGLEQLKGYSHATGAPILVLTDGIFQYNLYITEPYNFEDLPDIPKYHETVEDIRKKKITYSDLEEPYNLKKIILDLENAVLAHAGVNGFDEIFKLIYAKLYDEIKTPKNDNRRFRIIAGTTNQEIKDQIARLFNDAKEEWRDIFKPSDEIEIPNNAIAPAISLLAKYRFFGTNLSIID